MCLLGIALDPHPGLKLVLAANRDEELPDTGLPLAVERLLAPPFIVSPSYGTRSSAVVVIDHDGSIRFEERSYDPSGALVGSARVDVQGSAAGH